MSKMVARDVLRPLSLAVLCVCPSLPLLPQVPAAQSSEVLTAPKIDGETGDWPASRLVLDAKSGIESAFQNDGNDFYILLVVKKTKARASLESTGMTLLVSVGPRKTKRGFLFLKQKVPAETYIRWHESLGAVITEEEKTKLRNAGQHDLCLVFAVGATGSTYGPLRNLPGSNPPEFGVSEEAAETIYELKIPLQSPELVPSGLGILPGEDVRISFEWGGTARKVFSTKSTLEATPLEKKGDLSGSGRTWAQEFLDSFDSMSRRTMGTKKFSFAVDVRLADAE